MSAMKYKMLSLSAVAIATLFANQATAKDIQFDMSTVSKASQFQVPLYRLLAITKFLAPCFVT